MNRSCLVTTLATALAMTVGSFVLTQTVHADGFEAFGARAAARQFGVNMGQGYHAVPCAKHLVQHYNRSISGVTHPMHRLTPIYHQNTPGSFRLRGRRDERLPYFMGNSMPPVDAPPRPPTVSSYHPGFGNQGIQQNIQPQAAEPHKPDSEQDGEDDGEPEAADRTGLDDNFDEDAEDDYKIERLPRLDSTDDDLYDPSDDGSEFSDVELDELLKDNLPQGDESSALPLNAPLSAPLSAPLWEENAPGRPRLYDGQTSVERRNPRFSW